MSEPKYRVECKAFRTGEWYTKTKTDSYASARSVMTVGNYGRAMRLIDTETDKIMGETQEDPEMKKVNGNVYNLQLD